MFFYLVPLTIYLGPVPDSEGQRHLGSHRPASRKKLRPRISRQNYSTSCICACVEFMLRCSVDKQGLAYAMEIRDQERDLSYQLWRSKTCNRPLRILVVGRRATGKATLIRTFLGNEMKISEDQQSKAVTTFEGSVDGVSVVMYASPAPLEENVNTTQTLLEMGMLNDGEVDLMYYCMSLRTAKLTEADMLTLLKLSNVFGNQICKHIIFVLTFANEKCDEPGFSKLTETFMHNVKMFLQYEILLSSEDIADMPFVLAGKHDHKVQNLQVLSWTDDLFHMSLERANPKISPSLLRIDLTNEELEEMNVPKKQTETADHTSRVAEKIGEITGQGVGAGAGAVGGGMLGALGGGVTGAGIGAGIGAVAGVVGGPLGMAAGAAVGAKLGGLVGGFFGGVSGAAAGTEILSPTAKEYGKGISDTVMKTLSSVKTESEVSETLKLRYKISQLQSGEATCNLNEESDTEETIEDHRGTEPSLEQEPVQISSHEKAVHGEIREDQLSNASSEEEVIES